MRASIARLAGVISRHLRAAGRRESLETVAGINADLTAAGRQSEEAFLRVGDKLGRLVEAVDGISRRASSIAEPLAGQSGPGALLRGVLRDIEAAQASSQSGQMSRLVAGAASLEPAMDRIRSVVRTFRLLATLMQIESVRLEASAAGFADFAGEVKTLAAGIEQQSESILAASHRMRESIQVTAAEVLAAEKGRMARLPAAAEGVGCGLKRLEEERQLASGTLRSLADRYAGTRRRIGDLVAALQFQDITRQQLEHVRDALANAAAHVGENDGARRLSAVAELQRAQLRATAASFRTSVAGIRGSLSSLADEGARMAEEARELAGRGSDRSYHSDMERGLNEILAILGDCSRAEEHRTSGLRTLADAMGHMNTLTASIQGITLRIERIALNATIRAIQSGAPGSALATVASAVQEVAAEASTVADGFAELLGGMREIVCLLGSVDGGYGLGSGRLRDGLRDLAAAREATFRHASEIGSFGARLAADLEETRRRFGTQDEFPALLDECVQRLAGLVTAPGAAEAAGLEDLRSQYTMEAERAVHDAVAGETEEPAVVAAGSGLGDNVELF